VYSLIINNKLSTEDNFGEQEDYYSNNFLDLSLKNSLIKGLYQKKFIKENMECSNFNQLTFLSKIILGIYESY